jgi:serine/threonine protein phosphatase PrpC
MQAGTKIRNQFGIDSAAVSDRGLNESRPHNEDSYLDLPEHGIFAVADGVGGAQAGEVASQMAIEILGEAFTNMPQDADAELIMRAAISKANEAIFEMSNELPQLSKMATTIVAMHVRDDVATIGHVGDSRLYRISPTGVIVQETLDHSIVAEEVRAGRMTEEEAAVHPSRNIISRALGAEPSVEIDLKTIMIEPGTSFLLCSDGITRHVANDEIHRILGNGNEVATACSKLKDLCFERGAEDNLTAVVVRVGPHSLSVAQSGLQTPFLDEDDEDTIATARVADEAAGFEEPTVIAPATRFEIVEDEEEAIDFEPEGADQLLVEPNDLTAEEDASVDEMATSLKPGALQPSQLETAPPAYAEPEPRRGSSFGRIAPLLLFFLVGAAAGAGGYYYWALNNPTVVVQQAPVITQQQTDTMPVTTYELEDSRRKVDSDPKRYIATNTNPQDAKDYFLLGRAFLLTGQWYQARNAFNTAKSRLSEVDPRDRQTISNEIEMALAIIGSGPATENFSKAIANASNSNASANR